MENRSAISTFSALVQTTSSQSSRRRFLQVGAATSLAVRVGSAVHLKTADAQATPPSENRLRMSFGPAVVESFDPISTFDNATIWTLLLIYDQLVRVAPDGSSLEPGLAERWEIAEDGLTYTFHLRQSTFHDGVPCTADDVVYSLNRVISDPASTWASLYTSIATVSAADPATVVITLVSPWVPLLADLALFAASVIPKAAHETRQSALFDNPIGTGPFTVSSWNPQEGVLLRKHPAYWDNGKPILDEVHILAVPGADDRLTQVLSGQLDIAFDIPYDASSDLLMESGVTVIHDPLARIDFFSINTGRPPFDDKALRQALNYAVDKDEIIRTVLAGGGEIATTFLPKMPLHDDTAPGYPFDRAKAQELVAGSAAAGGFDVELLIASDQDGSEAIAGLVAAGLEHIAGRVTITALSNDEFFARFTNGDYELALNYVTTDIIDPDELTSLMAVGTGETQALYTYYNNQDLNALAVSAPAMADPDQRADAYKRIQTLFSDDAPLLFLYYSKSHAVSSSHINNFHILPTGNVRLWETWRDDTD